MAVTVLLVSVTPTEVVAAKDNESPVAHVIDELSTVIVRG